MEDSKLVIILCITVVILIGMPIGCVMQENTVILEAVKSGADPIAVKCAMGGTAQESMCIAKAAQKER